LQHQTIKYVEYLKYEKPASGCVHHSRARTPNAGCAIYALLLVLLGLALQRCLLFIDHLLGFSLPFWLF
jgi:hypothetical protein